MRRPRSAHPAKDELEAPRALAAVIDELIQEHAALRALARWLERTTDFEEDGRRCPLEELRSRQRRFEEELKEHEGREERLLARLSRLRTPAEPDLEPEIRRAHGSLEGMTALLRTLSGVCDGAHMGAVRSMTGRLREELELHLLYEEKVLFPLLRRRLPS